VSMTVRSQTMPLADSSLAARLVAEHGVKALRYCGVSVVNVLTGVTTLAICHGLLHWSAVSSNVTAWSVSTVPAYLLSRAWVWRQAGSHRLRGELLPFWILALVGLLFSTFVVKLIEQQTERTLFIVAGNIAAYGVVWVIKYVVLDKVMWRDPVSVDPVEVA
jgi:putative flippase GtrA